MNADFPTDLLHTWTHCHRVNPYVVSCIFRCEDQPAVNRRHHQEEEQRMSGILLQIDLL